MHAFSRSLARAVKNARDKMNLTQEQVGELVDTNTRTISSIENGNCDSNTGIHFCMLHDIDPYIRKFVSPVGHSHHGYFIDPRPIGCTAHLWATFLSTA